MEPSLAQGLGEGVTGRGGWRLRQGQNALRPVPMPLSLPTRPSCLSSFIAHREIKPQGEAACSEVELPTSSHQASGAGQSLSEFLV